MRRGGGWRKRGGKSAAQWASTRSSAPLDLRDVGLSRLAPTTSRREQPTLQQHGNELATRDEGGGNKLVEAQ